MCKITRVCGWFAVRFNFARVPNSVCRCYSGYDNAGGNEKKSRKFFMYMLGLIRTFYSIKFHMHMPEMYLEVGKWMY